jgi:hypothetical protein
VRASYFIQKWKGMMIICLPTANPLAYLVSGIGNKLAKCPHSSTGKTVCWP